MITIKKEMIKYEDRETILYDNFDGSTLAYTKLQVDIKELDYYVNIDVYSSLSINQKEIIENMSNLRGLKYKMLPSLLENHTYKEKRFTFFDIDKDGLDFDDEAIKFLEEIKEETNEYLKDACEEQIKNHFTVN